MLAALRPLPARRAARVLVAVLAALAAAFAAQGDLLLLALALVGIAVVEALGWLRLDDPDDPWTVTPAKPARAGATPDPTVTQGWDAADERNDGRDASVREGWADADRWADGWPSAVGTPSADQLGKQPDRKATSGWSQLDR